MIEVSIFTVVLAHPAAPSVVVLAKKGPVCHATEAPGISGGAGAAEASADVSAAVGAAGVAERPLSSAPASGPDTADPQLLPIWIGHNEAEAIMLLLENRPHVRPLTYDLLASVIGTLGSRVEHVVIDRILDATFFATVCLDRDGRMIHIDARPSDSIALAIRTGARIFVDEDVMNAAARQFRIKVSDGGELLYGSTEEMERFHAFIESVSPEDFI
ncbi:MAG: bifunctional nuclease family protein [Coriobacteriales bacterium]|jgi:bifunctional DNase/RNase|nr:bifunctional nuclease family protein [Coriobacteriales bacterium]